MQTVAAGRILLHLTGRCSVLQRNRTVGGMTVHRRRRSATRIWKGQVPGSSGSVVTSKTSRAAGAVQSAAGRPGAQGELAFHLSLKSGRTSNPVDENQAGRIPSSWRKGLRSWLVRPLTDWMKPTHLRRTVHLTQLTYSSIHLA